MAADLYDLMTLQGVSRRVKVAPAFWLTEFYKQQINFDQEYISFDRVFEDKRYLAPFVVPNVSGRPNRLSGYTSERFKPAYTKQKDIVDPTMHMERLAGEAYGGTLTLQQRRDAVIAYLIQTQKEKTHQRRRLPGNPGGLPPRCVADLHPDRRCRLGSDHRESAGRHQGRSQAVERAVRRTHLAPDLRRQRMGAVHPAR
jgi:hypothetical protein